MSITRRGIQFHNATFKNCNFLLFRIFNSRRSWCEMAFKELLFEKAIFKWLFLIQHNLENLITWPLRETFIPTSWEGPSHRGRHIVFLHYSVKSLHLKTKTDFSKVETRGCRAAVPLCWQMIPHSFCCLEVRFEPCGHFVRSNRKNGQGVTKSTHASIFRHLFLFVWSWQRISSSSSSQDGHKPMYVIL